MMQPAIQLLFHDVLQLMGIVIIHHPHADGVRDHVDRRLVGQDPRIGLEDRRGRWLLDMRLDRHRILSRDLQQREEQAKQILVVGPLPFRSLEYTLQILESVLDGRTVVGDDERTDRGAADHHHLERQRMENDPELAAGDQDSHRKPCRARREFRQCFPSLPAFLVCFSAVRQQ